MAQTGFTPIVLFHSATTTNAPTAGNLAAGELALNTADGFLFYKDDANAIQKIGYKLTPVAAGGTGSTTASDARTALGLAIGTNVQAYDADLTTWAGITPGTGVGTALAINVGSAGAPVVLNGALGTPSSGTLTNATGLPLSTGVTGTLPVANGGTGLTTTPANGALDIGNGTGFTRGTLTAGTNITITNSAGGISIAAAGGTSQWTTTGSNIYYTTGKVGIGTSTIGTTLVLASSDSSTIGQLRYARSVDTGFYWETGRDNSLSGDFLFSNANGGAKTEQMRINGSGTVILQGGSTSATGVGITFPATQNPSSDANTLDDYREGTWTPSQTNLTVVGTPTYAGSYTKIGNRVILWMSVVATTSTASIANNTYFTGLPFTAGERAASNTVGSGTASLPSGYIDGIYLQTPTWSATAATIYTNATYKV